MGASQSEPTPRLRSELSRPTHTLDDRGRIQKHLIDHHIERAESLQNEIRKLGLQIETVHGKIADYYSSRLSQLTRTPEQMRGAFESEKIQAEQAWSLHREMAKVARSYYEDLARRTAASHRGLGDAYRCNSQIIERGAREAGMFLSCCENAGSGCEACADGTVSTPCCGFEPCNVFCCNCQCRMGKPCTSDGECNPDMSLGDCLWQCTEGRCSVRGTNVARR